VTESGPQADETLIRDVARVLYLCDRGDWAGAMEAWDEDEYRDTAYHRMAQALSEAGLLAGAAEATAERYREELATARKYLRHAQRRAIEAQSYLMTEPHHPDYSERERVRWKRDHDEYRDFLAREALHPQPDNEGRA
jgi:hypothetical protein